MAVPPKGDPRRPLVLAVRSTRLLGIIFIVFGVFASIAMMASVGATGGAGFAVRWVQALAVGFYVVPGVVYLLCAIYLKQRRSWAAVVALVVCLIHLLMALVGLAATIISTLSVNASNSGVSGIWNWVVWIPVALLALITAALIQTIVYLSQSFRSIREWPGDERRGFEPLAIQAEP
jgi:hypothetical protein